MNDQTITDLDPTPVPVPLPAGCAPDPLDQAARKIAAGEGGRVVWLDDAKRIRDAAVAAERERLRRLVRARRETSTLMLVRARLIADTLKAEAREQEARTRRSTVGGGRARDHTRAVERTLDAFLARFDVDPGDL